MSKHEPEIYVSLDVETDGPVPGQSEDAPALAAWMRRVEDCLECGRVRLGDLPSPDGCQDGDRLFGQLLLEGRF